MRGKSFYTTCNNRKLISTLKPTDQKSVCLEAEMPVLKFSWRSGVSIRECGKESSHKEIPVKNQISEFNPFIH